MSDDGFTDIFNAFHPDGSPSRPVAYEASHVKRRRRTNADLDAINNAIVAAVATEHPTTLRGVYYRVVSAGAVEKTEQGYQLVGRQLLKLRRSGRVPYHWITDGTRLIQKPDSWSALDTMLDSAAKSYRRALWDDQKAEVMVLSEKDAISGAIYPITAKWDVELAIVRGYSSETFTHSIAETLAENWAAEKTTYLYQLGDHDPSGVDAWRSFEEKVRGFVSDITGAHPKQISAEFERIAVLPWQIMAYDLPTRPTKATDTRSKNFAGESVEVDAIPASELRILVENAITQHIDHEAYAVTTLVEQEERRVLTRIAKAVA